MRFSELDQEALRYSVRSISVLNLIAHVVAVVVPGLIAASALTVPVVAVGHSVTVGQFGYLVLQCIAAVLIANTLHQGLFPKKEPIIDRLYRWSLFAVRREWKGQRLNRSIQEIRRGIINVDFSQALELTKIEPRLAQRQQFKMILRQKRRLMSPWLSANPERLEEVRLFLLLCIEAEKRRDQLVA